jgi:hypothetical protein
MRTIMRTVFVNLTAIALGVTPGFAQNLEQVKPVFEHIIPNAQGKRMVAIIVNYPAGGKSPSHHHAQSAFIYAYVLSGAIRSQVGDEPAKVYRSVKVSTKCPALITGSVRMRVTKSLQAYWPSSSSIPTIIP